ncbi:hypothetical protein ACIHFD_58750 [Nonomuraea sp. NPDC051941]
MNGLAKLVRRVAILGGPTLTGTLLLANLMVNPIILGDPPYYRPQG